MGLQFLADQCVPTAVVEDLRDRNDLSRNRFSTMEKNEQKPNK